MCREHIERNEGIRSASGGEIMEEEEEEEENVLFYKTDRPAEAHLFISILDFQL